ncbi:MAG: transglycosylase domain-containing protein [Gammaproteobacteria bacterium]|nr:transglycosylase domain-containing protein [Gammaproteobacteria bacterium]
MIRRFAAPLRWLIGLVLIGVLVLAWMTHQQLAPNPISLEISDGEYRPRVYARDATALRISYQSRWNVDDYIRLHDVPKRLRDAVILAEDQHFFEHAGMDWPARLHALWQNIVAMRTVRGASTITEQVVRIVQPRPRGLWARWIESFEAIRIERAYSKSEILEFYLNQVPYAANRRGVAQAARYYFSRALNTLSDREMLTLAVLVRAPSRLDLHRNPNGSKHGVRVLADRMRVADLLSKREHTALMKNRIETHRVALRTDAAHFVRHALRHQASTHGESKRAITTTLDPHLQRRASALLNERLDALEAYNARDGGLVIVDHVENHIVSWVVATNGEYSPFGIDTVITRRQPGSTLKPFLYALALERGWSAATEVPDAPLADAVGVGGLHQYRNYSRRHYGAVSVRDALGNSLNIPAIHTVKFVGIERFLQRLHRLGLRSLTKRADHYGEGLALGNAEVTLLELVEAYASIARQGRFTRAAHSLGGRADAKPTAVFSAEVATLVANILSDDQARRLEFGANGVLALPHQTAVKTGTSTDFRDAWAIGFNHRYTVGVWIGNLDRRPMRGVTGARGPAMILRSVFAELERKVEPRALALSPNLVVQEVCQATPDRSNCRKRNEYFLPKRLGAQPTVAAKSESHDAPTIRQPVVDLRLARDPRIPDALERFEFEVSGEITRVQWLVDDKVVGESAQPTWLWPLTPGTHTVSAVATTSDGKNWTLGPRRFYVR